MLGQNGSGEMSTARAAPLIPERGLSDPPDFFGCERVIAPDVSWPPPFSTRT